MGVRLVVLGLAAAFLTAGIITHGLTSAGLYALAVLCACLAVVPKTHRR
jgi:DMSO/TMAO reductase YedYZ heme-binding membrane subunit